MKHDRTLAFATDSVKCCIPFCNTQSDRPGWQAPDRYICSRCYKGAPTELRQMYRRAVKEYAISPDKRHHDRVQSLFLKVKDAALLFRVKWRPALNNS